MRDMYHVIDEDGLYRMFDVSHDGLEDAIEVANEIGTDVVCERDGVTETVWSFEGSDDDQLGRGSGRGRVGECWIRHR